MQVKLNKVLLKAEEKLKDWSFDLPFWITKNDIIPFSENILFPLDVTWINFIAENIFNFP